MKLKSTLLAATLAMFAGAIATAIAAEAEKPEAVTAEQGEAKKMVKKPVKKHSHMEEKTNVPMNESAPHMDKEMSKDRHDHMKEKH
ncbi:MAG: hypothetical protein M0P59_05435 [Gallionella sp.]|jgi:hypothetical protein|nr:hypothetical protein [Gallionella sp.]MCK9353585.1 hypothetical protein [Gallionella sp.]